MLKNLIFTRFCYGPLARSLQPSRYIGLPQSQDRTMPTCDLLKPHDLTPADLAAWRDMMAATPAFASPLLSPDFVRAVAAVRGDVRVAVFREGPHAVGFLAHHRRPNRFARPAGAPFSDYTALLTFPNTTLRARDALARAGIDRFHAIGMVDPYGVFGAIEGTPDDAYAMDLSSEDPGNNVDKKLQKNINRLRRRTEEALGEVRIVAGDRNPTHFETMMRLKREQVTRGGMHDFLGAPWVQRLMRDLFEAPQDGLHGFLVTLMAGDTPLSHHFGPRLGTHAHPWVSAFDPAFGQFSPGQVFLNDVRQPLKAAGVTWYDLSTGQQHYKPMFCNHHTVVHHATVFGGSPAGRLKAGFLDVARGMQRALGPLDGLLARVDRRMDQIASLELDTFDRLRGFGFALATASRRTRSDHG